jgi:hypothetical protein
LQDSTQIPPIYQKVYKDNRELLDSTKTMSDYNVLPGDEILVELYDFDHDIDAINEDAGNNEFETGFIGTKLYSNPSNDFQLDSWNCKCCTYLNENGSQCKICYNER